MISSFLFVLDIEFNMRKNFVVFGITRFIVESIKKSRRPFRDFYSSSLSHILNVGFKFQLN